jgi:hypothetical protein
MSSVAIREASGGKCGPGALSAAVPAAAAPLVGDIVKNAPDGLRGIEGGAISGVVGGLAAVAGGGKFADGAVTGAFGCLFNWFTHNSHEYETRAFICDTSDDGCSRSAVFDGLLHNAYPGQPAGSVVQPGDYTVTGGNPIRVSIDSDNFSITNKALSADQSADGSTHFFCCGSVTVSVEQNGTGIFLHAYGAGPNLDFFGVGYIRPALNYAAGQAFFGAIQPVHVRQYVVGPPPLSPP